MIKLICPSCGQHIEAPDEARFQKLKCPACANEFDPAALPRKFSKVDDIRNTADNFRAAALLFGGLGALTIGAAFIAGILAGSSASVLICGGAMMGVAFWFYLIAQIMHIRANTHK